MTEIEQKVKEIIVDKLGVDEAKVTMDANFISDLNADSLDTVELIMEFEKKFNVEIPDDAAEKISTVGDAIKYNVDLNGFDKISSIDISNSFVNSLTLPSSVLQTFKFKNSNISILNLEKESKTKWQNS